MQGIYNVKDFGAKGDASTNDSPKIQDAINSAQQNGGGIVFFPAGFYLVCSPITISSGVKLLGSGTGVGVGAGNSGGTVIRVGTPTQDVFVVSSDEAVLFQDFTIDSSVTKTDGAGIKLNGATSGYNARSRLQNIRILGQYIGVHIERASGWVIRDCHIQDFRNVGIWVRQLKFTNGGDNHISGCTIWDLNVHTSQACIRYDEGGAIFIQDNKLLGAEYGIRLILVDGPTGTMVIQGNSIEQQTISGFLAELATEGKKFANLIINGNQFSILAPVNPQTAINIIASSTPQWLSNVIISNNVFNMGYTNRFPIITVNDGNTVTIANNVITNLGNKGPIGIGIGGNAKNVLVKDNQIIDVPSGKYGALNSQTILRDLTGMPFAMLQQDIADGSEVYVIDGQTNPTERIPLVSGGSGAWARKIEGVWYSG